MSNNSVKNKGIKLVKFYRHRTFGICIKYKRETLAKPKPGAQQQSPHKRPLLSLLGTAKSQALLTNL